VEHDANTTAVITVRVIRRIGARLWPNQGSWQADEIQNFGS
jgi:hypothetical protein